MLHGRRRTTSTNKALFRLPLIQSKTTIFNPIVQIPNWVPSSSLLLSPLLTPKSRFIALNTQSVTPSNASAHTFKPRSIQQPPSKPENRYAIIIRSDGFEASYVSQSPCGLPDPPHERKHENVTCWTKPAVDRLVIIILDALRFPRLYVIPIFQFI